MYTSQLTRVVTQVARASVCRPRAPCELSYMERSGHSSAVASHDDRYAGRSSVSSAGLYRSPLDFEGGFGLYVTDGDGQRLGGWSKHFIGRL